MCVCTYINAETLHEFRLFVRPCAPVLPSPKKPKRKRKRDKDGGGEGVAIVGKKMREAVGDAQDTASAGRQPSNKGKYALKRDQYALKRDLYTLK